MHVYIGVSSQGQSHETTMAQIAAAELGVDPERVFVIAADTTLLPYGNGTGGSRVAANAGPVGGAHRARSGGQGAAWWPRRCSSARPPTWCWPRAGRTWRACPSAGVALGDLARAAVRSKTLLREARPGLQACGYFAPETVTFAFGAQACAVEVDVETGRVRILRYLAVHDCGRAINPMIVDGQLHGGLAGGHRHRAVEDLIYDAEGQLLTGSLMDYAIPSPPTCPRSRPARWRSPPRGTSSASRAWARARSSRPPAAIANAVEDALADPGARTSLEYRSPPRASGSALRTDA